MKAHFLAISACFSAPVFADSPLVENVAGTKSGDTWSFSVTVSHPDTGWDHYADGWEVTAPDGTQLGFRKLLHPHVNEQPFTRSLSGVAIPEGMAKVMVRAHDSVHGWGEPVEFVLE